MVRAVVVLGSCVVVGVRVVLYVVADTAVGAVVVAGSTFL